MSYVTVLRSPASAVRCSTWSAHLVALRKRAPRALVVPSDDPKRFTVYPSIRARSVILGWVARLSPSELAELQSAQAQKA